MISIVCKMSSYIYAEIKEEFNKTNSFCIAHTEQVIDAII